MSNSSQHTRDTCWPFQSTPAGFSCCFSGTQLALLLQTSNSSRRWGVVWVCFWSIRPGRWQMTDDRWAERRSEWTGVDVWEGGMVIGRVVRRGSSGLQGVIESRGERHWAMEAHSQTYAIGKVSSKLQQVDRIDLTICSDLARFCFCISNNCSWILSYTCAATASNDLCTASKPSSRPWKYAFSTGVCPAFNSLPSRVTLTRNAGLVSSCEEEVAGAIVTTEEVLLCPVPMMIIGFLWIDCNQINTVSIGRAPQHQRYGDKCGTRGDCVWMWHANMPTENKITTRRFLNIEVVCWCVDSRDVLRVPVNTMTVPTIVLWMTIVILQSRWYNQKSTLHQWECCC